MLAVRTQPQGHAELSQFVTLYLIANSSIKWQPGCGERGATDVGERKLSLRMARAVLPLRQCMNMLRRRVRSAPREFYVTVHRRPGNDEWWRARTCPRKSSCSMFRFQIWNFTKPLPRSSSRSKSRLHNLDAHTKC